MAETITTEQYIDYVFDIRDGRDRPKDYEGEAVIASSDETVATVSMTDRNTLRVTSVAPGSCRVSATVDVKEGEEVDTRTGTADIEVTLDERTGARVFSLKAGEAADKPV